MHAMPTPDAPAAVGAVVALKTLHQAKTRLADVPAPLRRRLAWTMAVDTLSALAAGVDRVVVISDEPALQARLSAEGLPVEVLGEAEGTGMNAALAHGERWLRDHGTQTVLACVADLPALTGAAVSTVLHLAGTAPGSRSFVADRSGVGTTILISSGTDLDPRFEGPSAAAHRASGATDLVATGIAVPPTARHDVDTLADLYSLAPAGLGPATAALLDPTTGRLARHRVITVAGPGQVITADGVRLTATAAAPALPLQRGQRLHAAVGAEGVLSLWW